MISGGFSRGNPPAHWHSIDTIHDGPLAAQNSVIAVAAWPTADLAVYVPLTVRERVTVKRMWYGNGNTSGGNFDIGLYDATGAALLRKGSAAKPATTGIAAWDCSDTTIDPGIYYIALAMNNNTGTLARISVSAPYLAGLGVYSQVTAFPLPSSATFATANTLAYYPVLGLYLAA